MRPYGLRQLCPSSGYKSMTANSCQCSFSSAWVLCLATTISKYVHAGQRKFAGLFFVPFCMNCCATCCIYWLLVSWLQQLLLQSPHPARARRGLTSLLRHPLLKDSWRSLSQAARATLTLASPGNNRHPQCPQRLPRSAQIPEKVPRSSRRHQENHKEAETAAQTAVYFSCMLGLALLQAS